MTPNFSVICAHLREAKTELDRHPAEEATAASSDWLRRALEVLAPLETHHRARHPEDAQEADLLAGSSSK